MSQKAGYDVGTPATVDALMSLAEEAKEAAATNEERKTSQGLFPGQPLMGWLSGFPMPASREEIIGNYLFEHDINLNGELRRFGSRRNHQPEERVAYDFALVAQYTSENGLSREFAFRVCDLLHIL